MASDTESDGYGAFDFAEFTSEDFAQIDTRIACHFVQQQEEVNDDDDDTDETHPAAANESFAFDTSLDLNALTEEDLLAIDNAVKVQLNVDSAAVTPHPLPASPLLPVIEALASVVEAPHAEAIIPAPVTTVPLPVKRPQNKGKKKAWEDRSLMEKFRPSGVLSVSDLVAPTWCEVQYDYGLRQRRSRPVNQRPKSFKTSTGKEITVEVKVAAKNDVRTKQGQAVHKELEREIRGEEIRIETRSDEERWGLRLLNMIACFNILIEEGLTREMPVFGMTNGAIIIGIIDEILKVELPAESPGKRRMSHTTPRNSPKRAKRTPPPNQQEIEDFFPPSPQKPAKVNQRAASSSPTRSLNGISTTPTSPRYTLRVSDTKTRVTDTMPPEADTRGPQLQVMLYRRLLSALTSTTEPFDFPALWDQLGVDPQAEFSTLFLVQAGLLEHNEGFKTTNLDGLVCNWERVVREAEKRGVRGVDESMSLVYRLQPESMKGKGKGRASAPSGLALWNASRQRAREKMLHETGDGGGLSKEAREVAIAIRNSLLDLSSNAAEGSSAKEVAGHTGMDVDADAGIDVELQNALYQSLSPHPLAPTNDTKEPQDPDIEMVTPAPALITSATTEAEAAPLPAPTDIDASEPLPPPPQPEEIDIHGYKIIGRKDLVYDGPMLQAHIDSVFEFWRGERQPVGVPVELSRRCNTCEYRNGCEWREEKALELLSEQRKVSV